MVRLPTVLLEGNKLQRVILSVRPPSSGGLQEVLSLMKKAYEGGAWCFDLPSSRHHQSFKELYELTEDPSLTGLPHVGAEEGVSLSGIPLHRVESKVVSTIMKHLFAPDLVRTLKEAGLWKSPSFFPSSVSMEVLTQKEIDRMSFDPSRFERALSPFQPKTFPFLIMGGRYGDWLLGLGRADLLKKMVSAIREKGLIPILSGQWATFFLPKAKPLDAAAYAIPINKKWGFFDLGQASELVKRFDKPVISLNPFGERELLTAPEEAFSFLFDELKVYCAIAEVSSGEEVERVLTAAEKIPSLRPHRRA